MSMRSESVDDTSFERIGLVDTNQRVMPSYDESFSFFQLMENVADLQKKCRLCRPLEGVGSENFYYEKDNGAKKLFSSVHEKRWKQHLQKQNEAENLSEDEKYVLAWLDKAEEDDESIAAAEDSNEKSKVKVEKPTWLKGDDERNALPITNIEAMKHGEKHVVFGVVGLIIVASTLLFYLNGSVRPVVQMSIIGGTMRHIAIVGFRMKGKLAGVQRDNSADKKIK